MKTQTQEKNQTTNAKKTRIRKLKSSISIIEDLYTTVAMDIAFEYDFESCENGHVLLDRLITILDMCECDLVLIADHLFDRLESICEDCKRHFFYNEYYKRIYPRVYRSYYLSYIEVEHEYHDSLLLLEDIVHLIRARNNVIFCGLFD